MPDHPAELAVWENKGVNQALKENPHLCNGLNVHTGKLTYKEVADDLGYDYTPASVMIN